MKWTLIPGALRAERQRRGWTIGALAHAAGVADKTIVRLENGQEAVRDQTVFLLARTLGCAMEVIALSSSAPARSPRDRVAASRARSLAPDSVTGAPLQPITVPPARSAPPELLTPELLPHIRTAFRVYDGSRVAVAGRVVSQAPLTDLERYALGCARGTGARFAITRGTGRATIRIAAYAITVESTGELQSALKLKMPMQGVARIAVVDGSADHPTVPGAEGLSAFFFRHNWRGFVHEGTDELLKWTFVLEACALA